MSKIYLNLIANGIDVAGKSIILVEEIDEPTLSRVLIAIQAMKLETGDTLRITLATDGGCVYAGLGVYDLLEGLKARGVVVEITGVGKVMSMGTAILQAATPGHRLLTVNTSVLLHLGSESFGEAAHPHEVERRKDEFDRLGTTLATILGNAMRMGPKTWAEEHALDTFLTAEDAVAAGVADRVVGTSVTAQFPEKRTRKRRTRRG